MHHARRHRLVFCAAVILGIALPAMSASAQQPYGPNGAPNLYKFNYGWAKLPDRRKFGAVVGVDIDRDGKSVWAFDRCESATDCSKSNLDPIMKFDSTGKVVKSFGGGMINYPHGLHVDKDNNIWVSDGRAMNNGKGHTVMKFNQDGKLLMTLGKPGIAGSGPDTFSEPSDILVAPNGDIFVADGHGGPQGNNRIVKFDKDGKFIKELGPQGDWGPGEFNVPHMLAMDSPGGCSSPTAATAASRFSTRTGKFLAGVEAVRSAERLVSSTRTTTCMSPIRPRPRRPIRALGRASGSAASRTAACGLHSGDQGARRR